MQIKCTRNTMPSAQPATQFEAADALCAIPAPELLTQINAAVSQDLAKIEKYAIESLDSPIPLIQQIGRHIAEYGGKRLRPITVTLSARALGYQGHQHIVLATILEFIHVATLLHDDVVDESSMRRGRLSANSIWGNAASVLVGDFFYSRSFELLVVVNRLPIFDVMAQATRRISEGEVMQLAQLQCAETTEKEYFETIERKTASLFWAAAKMGAIIADQPEPVQQQMANFGRNLGIAFQLVDDCLDYVGESARIGKKVGDDLHEGKLTLPLIHALEHGDARQTEVIQAALKAPELADIAQICDIVVSTGALEYTIALARDFSTQAAMNLSDLPQTRYRNALIQLTEFAHRRNF